MDSVTPRSVLTFAAGPSQLPQEVLFRIQKDFLNYEGTGISILETSHRSAEFSKICDTAENLIRDLLHVPDNYKVIFLQGGASGQFASIPMNLINLRPGRTVDYVVTGMWSAKAAKEAAMYGESREVFPTLKNNTVVPDQSTWTLNPDASYLYYCDNETINGVEFEFVPNPPPGVTLICDMSSNIMTRPVDVSKYGVIMVGAQKNIGCAGVTVVIVRDDLLNCALPITPSILNFKIQAGMNSLLNTPATFSIYVMTLMLDWTKRHGGVEGFEKLSREKSGMLYDLMEASNGFYKCTIEPGSRSRTNIVFRVLGGDEAVENRFVKEAAKRGLVELKGHRAVGGLRISVYNSHTVEEVQLLKQFMLDFMHTNQSS